MSWAIAAILTVIVLVLAAELWRKNRLIDKLYRDIIKDIIGLENWMNKRNKELKQIRRGK